MEAVRAWASDRVEIGVAGAQAGAPTRSLWADYCAWLASEVVAGRSPRPLTARAFGHAVAAWWRSLGFEPHDTPRRGRVYYVALRGQNPSVGL